MREFMPDELWIYTKSKN